MDDTGGTDGSGEESSVERTAALAGLYLESLAARMDPAEFEALSEGLRQFGGIMMAGGEGVLDLDDGAFTEDVRKELMMVMTIVGTGRMDYEVVDVPGPDGASGWAVVDAKVAADPVRLASLREKMLAWKRDGDAVEAELQGIEEATGRTPEP